MRLRRRDDGADFPAVLLGLHNRGDIVDQMVPRIGWILFHIEQDPGVSFIGVFRACVR